MAEKFTERVEILNSENKTILILDAETAELILRQVRRLRVAPGGRIDAPVETIRLNGSDGEIVCNDLRLYDNRKLIDAPIDITRPGRVIKTGSLTTVELLGDRADLAVGGSGQVGDIAVRTSDGTNTILISGGEARRSPSLRLCNNSGQTTIILEGSSGNAYLGGNGQDGDVRVRNSSGQDTILLNGGAERGSPTLTVRNSAGQSTILLEGDSGNAYLGGNGQDGDLRVRNTAGENRILLSGGDAAGSPNLVVKNSAGQDTIQLDGNSGDITLKNADCAEEFDGVGELQPGTVVVLGEGGKVRQSGKPYDSAVAGIISGAGAYQPGIILDRQSGDGGRFPVALMGKVFCQVDATNGPINVGDLLTSSDTPGHAMKATDPVKAFGAVIGKALQPLHRGQGLIAVLATLQ